MFDSQTVRREGSEDEDEANRERTNRGQLLLSLETIHERAGLTVTSVFKEKLTQRGETP